MSESLLGTIISAFIAGVFRLIAKRMELSSSKTEALPAKQPVAGAINQSTAFMHIGIIQFIVNLSGFLVSMVFGLTPAFFFAQLLFGTAVAIAGFRWSALQVEKIVRWKHLILVAIGVAVTTLVVNSILLGTMLPLFTSEAYIFAFSQSFVSMGIGGYLADKTGG